MAVGSLVVEVAANVARFQSDMGKVASIAESKCKELDKAFSLVQTGLKAFGAAAVVGLTLDKVKSKIEDTISSAAGLKELAERTGGTVEKLSGLVGVAKLAGSDADTLAGGIQKLGKAMVDAQDGGKGSAEAFRAIGISVKDLKGLRPDEAFELIARQMAGYADGAEKTAVAQALLGKSGANLLPTMKDLAEMGELQVKVTSEQAAMADDYEKNLMKLNGAQGAMFKTIGMELLPVLNEFSKVLLDNLTNTNGVNAAVKDLAKDKSIRDWAEAAAVALAFLLDMLAADLKIVRALIGSGEAVVADASLMVAFVRNGFNSSNEEVKTALEKRNKTVEAANKRYVDLWNYDYTSMSRGLKERFEAMNRGEGGAPKEAPKPGINYRPNSAGDAGAAEADKTLKKILEGRLKVQEDFIAREKALEQTRFAYLDKFAALEYFTVRDAEERKQAVIAESLAATLQAYDAEIAAAKGFIAKAGKPEQRIEGENKLAEVVRKRAAAQADAAKLTTDSQIRMLEVQRKFDLATEEQNRQAGIANEEARFSIDMMGMDTLAVLKATEARRIKLALDERIYQLKKLDQNADTSKAEADAAIQTAKATALIEARYDKERTAIYGAHEAIRKYSEDASNLGAQTENVMTNAFRGMEDALVKFVQTGKMSFADLANSIIADLTRMIVKQAMFNAMAGMMNSSFGVGVANAMPGDSLDNFISLNGGFGTVPGRASGGPVNAGSFYQVNENGPELLNVSGRTYLMMGGQSGSVTPMGGSAAAAGGGGGTQVSVVVNNNAGRDTSATASSRTDAMGNTVIDVLVEKVEAGMMGRVSRGAGMAPLLERRYGLNPAAGAIR